MARWRPLVIAQSDYRMVALCLSSHDGGDNTTKKMDPTDSATVLRHLAIICNQVLDHSFLD